MMDTVNEHHEQAAPMKSRVSARLLIGAGMVMAGLVFLAEQSLRTGWLFTAFFPLLGVLLLLPGLVLHSFGLVIAGSIVSGVGTGVFVILNPALDLALYQRLGLMFAAFGAGFGLVWLISLIWQLKRPAWWALVPAGVLAGVGGAFWFTSLRFIDFVLYVLVGLGLALLAWGVFERLLGLIIPGCLLLGVGIGNYLAWGAGVEQNALSQTGIMLVCFALGFVLVIVFSRVVTPHFVWWPIIPGALLAVVGWGLYLGGNPGGAASFIGNTGSVALILLGLYLLLLRREIRK
ncbi:MAG: hypothetical protein GYA48_09220 [Chloroflexi bacterium]|nr:hypothetical protein [Chloroflexota bacterium]